MKITPILCITLFVIAAAVSAQVHSESSGPAPSPADVEKPLEIKQWYETRSGVIYAITRERGFLISLDQGATWKPRNDGLPTHIIYPFKGEAIRPLTALSVDPRAEHRVAVTTSTGLYVSTNAGTTWDELPIQEPIKKSAYITAVSLCSENKNRYIIGTSFSGIFETTDGGETWEERPENLDILYRGAGFYEDITGVSTIPANPDQIIISCGFGNGIYRTSENGISLERIPFPGDKRREHIKALIHTVPNSGETGGGNLRIITDDRTWTYATEREAWDWERHPQFAKQPEPDTRKKERLARSSHRFGIYLGARNGSGETLDGYLDFIEEHECNALTIDVKNDRGIITYNTELGLPREIGAVYEQFDLEELLKKAHDRGIYVIGRLVVFKDEKLYHYKENKYAIWDTDDNGPWGYRFKVENEETGETYIEQREFWVDPYSEFVWNYNVALAEELEERGMDEIQFDYIRFPSDGDFNGVEYRYRRDGMIKTEAIESFLKIAREKISIPISTDLYGFNSWYKMGNWIGQSIEVISHYADVICPMFYPSHFPRSFMEKTPYLDRAEQIYREGSDRAAVIVEGRSVIRPYIQAFLIGGELKFEKPTYTNYLIKQIEGTLSSEASGFTLWNNSNRYYMVTIPLNKYVKRDSQPEEGKEVLLN